MKNFLAIFGIALFSFFSILPMRTSHKRFVISKSPIVTKKEANELLMNYLRLKNRDEAKKLIENRKINVNYKDNSSNTPLSLALQNRDFEIAKLLIDAGANLDTKLFKSNTLLHYHVNHPEILKFLLEAGAKNFYDVNYEKMSPLDIAARDDNIDALLLMKAYGAILPNTLLTIAMDNTSVKVIKELLNILTLSIYDLNKLISQAKEGIIVHQTFIKDDQMRDKFLNIQKLLIDRKTLETFKSNIESVQGVGGVNVLVNVLVDAINAGNLYLVKYLLSLPLQEFLDSRIITLRQYLQIAKERYKNSKDEFIKKQYQEIGRELLKKLELLGEEGLISKQGLVPEGMPVDLPAEVKTKISLYKNL